MKDNMEELKSKKIKYIILSIIIIGICIGLFCILSLNIKYKKATDWLKGVYESSQLNEQEYIYYLEYFERNINYKDNKTNLLDIKYIKSNILIKDEEYEYAKILLLEINPYKESERLIQECKYKQANEMMEKKQYAKAIEILKEIKDYEDSSNIIKEAEESLNLEKYKDAVLKYEEGDFKESKAKFEEITSYKDSKKYIKNINKIQKITGRYTYNYYGVKSSYLIKESGWKISYLFGSDIMNSYDYELKDDVIIVYYNKELKLVKEKLKIGKKKLVSKDSNITFIYENSNTELPKKPSIGMTKDEARNSTWGEPTKINTTTTIYGVREQWVYSGYRYLYFDDGILTSIQD